MTDESDLLRAVLIDPSDDGPRLRYADWLDDHGDADQAEFIRLMPVWERSSGRGRVYARRRKLALYRLRVLVRSMFHTHHILCDLRYDHRKPLMRTSFPSQETVCVWSRGFISEITLPMAVFFGGDCQSCGPFARSVGLASIKYCIRCGGTGRTPGLAKSIFEQWPVTKVDFLDVGPFSSQPYYQGPVDFGRQLANLPPLTT